MNTITLDKKTNRCRVLADMIDRWHSELAQAKRDSSRARNIQVEKQGEMLRLQRRIRQLEVAVAAAGAGGRVAPPGLPSTGSSAVRDMPLAQSVPTSSCAASHTTLAKPSSSARRS